MTTSFEDRKPEASKPQPVDVLASPFDSRIATVLRGHVGDGPDNWLFLTTMLVSQKLEVSFPTPRAAALHLRSAWRAAHSAHELRKLIRWSNHPTRLTAHGDAVDVRSVAIEDSGALYDFFEATMLCAMSAFAAVEAYCNEVVVNRSTGPIKVKRRGHDEDGRPGKRAKTAEFTPEEVERCVSTHEKLKRIVPDILGVASPSGNAGLWVPYQSLRLARDSVTHFKRHDQARLAHQGLDQPTILYTFTQIDPFNFPEAAARLIRHFQDVPWLDDGALMRRPTPE